MSDVAKSVLVVFAAYPVVILAIAHSLGHKIQTQEGILDLVMLNAAQAYPLLIIIINCWLGTTCILVAFTFVWLS